MASSQSRQRDSHGRATLPMTASGFWAWGLLAVAVALVGTLAGCAPSGQAETAIVVAGADSPEQVLLSTLTVQALKAQGYRVVDKTALGSPWVVRSALEAGSVDVCWEYTGDTWMVHLAHDRPIADPAQVYEQVRAEDAAHGITWLAPAPCLRTTGLVMARGTARSLEIASISDLARYVAYVDPFTTLCTPEGLYGIAGGVRGIERVYGVRFRSDAVIYGTIEEGYARVADGECDCAMGYSLDTGLITHDLVALTDDRGFFQASHLAVAVRTPVLEALPELEADLERLSTALTRDAMTEMLRAVTVEGSKPQVVARRFLDHLDLSAQ
jgi:osmoprotectant transport system substrate-binding protein